jgi:hypothetical protein
MILRMKKYFVRRIGSLVLALALILGSFNGVTPIWADAAESNGIEVSSQSAGGGIQLTAGESGFAGGTGTVNDPYQIESDVQLILMQQHLDAHFILKKDIDLHEADWTPIGILTYSGDVNMDTGEMNMAKVFSGSLDGSGYKISNVNVTTDGDMIAVGGLFACSTGTVKNLEMENVTVAGDETTLAAGGVVGYAMGGTVSAITLTGASVTGTNCVGGIVGGSMCIVDGCTAENTEITVIGDNDFSDGRIIQCDVAECGGLIVGGGFGGSVKNCTATGTVTAEGNEPVGLGGIGGCLQCMTEISGNTAEVTITTAKGGHAIGGLCGYAGMGDDGNGTVAPPCEISDCNVKITINAPGATHVGGLVGTGLYFFGMEDRFNVTNCKVEGSITAGTDSTSPWGETVPGAVAGRAVGCNVSGCDFTALTINGQAAQNLVGITYIMYESGDQYDDPDDDPDGGGLLNGLAGSYRQGFGPDSNGAMLEERYGHYWHDYAAAVVGTAAADAMVAGLQGSVSGGLYGPAAITQYTEHPDSMQFFCGFRDLGDGLSTLTFNGTQISGFDADGTQLFTHSYRYIGKRPTDSGFDFYILESLDQNSGEYTYFTMREDTPDTTYHTEFRYGSNLADLLEFMTGDYAYWLACGISADADETMMEQVISLFVLENLLTEANPERTSGSLAGLADFIGTWDANDLPAGTELYFTLTSDGKGATYFNGQKAKTYNSYAYDSTGKKAGLYVARGDSEESEPEAARYTITTENGKTILSLTTLGGESISFTKRTSSGSDSSPGKSKDRGGSSNSVTPTAPAAPVTPVTPASNQDGSDVSGSAWYAPAVNYVLENKLMTGVGGGRFDPSGVGTRAMIWTILYRQAGSPAQNTADAKWYSAAQDWSKASGISDGSNPSSPITREQLASMLYSYAQKNGANPAATGDLTGFRDAGQVSAWASDAMRWAIGAGLISGKGNGTLDPTGTATRAEIAAILMRFSQNNKI